MPFTYACATCNRVQTVPSIEVAPTTAAGAICFACTEPGNPDIADALEEGPVGMTETFSEGSDAQVPDIEVTTTVRKKK